MAQIATSGIVSDIRGTTGGAIFAKNHYGNYFKSFASPINRNSQYQKPNYVNWRSIVKYWQFLTEDQRLTWKSLALTVTWHNKVGTAYHPTGQQLYLYCNQNLFTINQPFIASAVAPISQTLISSCNITENLINIYGMILHFTPTPTSTTIYYKVYASDGLSPGISHAYKYLKHIYTISPDTPTIFDLSQYYIARFGQPKTGKKIFIKLTPVESTSGFDSISVHCNFIAGNLIYLHYGFYTMFSYSY